MEIYVWRVIFHTNRKSSPSWIEIQYLYIQISVLTLNDGSYLYNTMFNVKGFFDASQ